MSQREFCRGPWETIIRYCVYWLTSYFAPIWSKRKVFWGGIVWVHLGCSLFVILFVEVTHHNAHGAITDCQNSAQNGLNSLKDIHSLTLQRSLFSERLIYYWEYILIVVLNVLLRMSELKITMSPFDFALQLSYDQCCGWACATTSQQSVFHSHTLNRLLFHSPKAVKWHLQHLLSWLYSQIFHQLCVLLSILSNISNKYKPHVQA